MPALVLASLVALGVSVRRSVSLLRGSCGVCENAGCWALCLLLVVGWLDENAILGSQAGTILSFVFLGAIAGVAELASAEIVRS